MKKLLFLIAAISMLFFSCSKDDDKNPEEQNNNNTADYAFCKTGNQWTYTNYSLSNPSISFNSTVKIESVDEAGWINVKYAMIFEFNQWWYVNDGSFSNMASPATGSLILFETGAEVGDIFEKSFTTDEGEVINRNEIIALNQTITVFAGTFTGCVKIHQTTSEDSVFYSDIWFSPEKGIIKSEGTTTEDYPEITVIELSSINF